jgi:hypothetical protein
MRPAAGTNGCEQKGQQTLRTQLIIAIDDYVPFESKADCAALDSLARSVFVPLLSATNIRLLAFEGSKQTHVVYQVI